MADNSSKLIKALFSSTQGEKKTNFDVGKIDPRILKILGLEEEFDLDYETYFSSLKEKMLLISLGKSKLSREDGELIIEEFKRLKSKKFPKKKITADSFRKGSTVSNIIGKQIIGKNIGLKAIKGISSKQLLLPPSDDKISNEKSDIKQIIDALSNIIEQLTAFNKLSEDELERDRKSRENKRRKQREGELERGFDGVMKAAEKVIAPVKSILDRIINFLVMTLIGRSLVLLLRWFSDPENKKKVEAIGRFLGDHWPKLLALFVAFGTGLGRFVRGLIGVIIKGTARLAQAVAFMLAKAGVGKAGKFGKFLGGKYGKLAVAGLEAAAVVGGTMALSKGIEDFSGIGSQQNNTAEGQQKVQKYSGGGYVRPRFPAFAGGGFNFKGMMGGAGMGAMFGPLGMILGGLFGSGKPQEMINGFVKGPGGPKDDKIPAMLSNGEFVMSAGAVQKYGVDTLEAMNAAGGGTNIPKISNGITSAAGGGYIGETPKEIKLRNAYEYRFGKDFASKLTNDQLRQISNHYNSLPPQMSSAIDSRRMMGYPDELKDMAERMIKGVEPKSFTQSSRATSGLDDLAKKFDMDARTAPRYAENLPKLNRPNSRIPRIDPSRMLPAAGESSANAMRAAARTARISRPPIPTSSAIVPYTGGGLVRSGVTAGLSESIPQIRTNMNVPGGRIRGGRGGLLGTILTTLAEIFAPQLGDATGSLYNKMGIGIGNLSDEQLKKKIEEELKLDQSLSESTKFVMGQNERLNLFQRESERRGLSGLKGGKILGGHGLRKQSFKDMPKTQIMTDDKGKPFIGYKAMRGGKPVYVRGPQPGQGTTNPLEALGRMINPGAYKDIDAQNQRKKYQQASAGNISSLKARGASQATISRERTRLNNAISPPSKPKVNVRYKPAGGGMGGRRGSGSKPSTATPKVPQFSSSASSRTRRRTAATYGIG